MIERGTAKQIEGCKQARQRTPLSKWTPLNSEAKQGIITWQSIVAGMQTFKRGHIWRVGDGTQINIWEDCWIPGSPSRKVMTRRGGSLVSKVIELVDPISSTWDIDLLTSMFQPVDVERILRIPLSQNLTEDFISWSATKSYTFSVRSAYYIEWEHQHGPMTTGLNPETSYVNLVWDCLWKLNVPSKVKIFCWRALHGIVPGMCILSNRHIKVSPQCPVCKGGAEDIRHLLFTCERARQVWKKLGVENIIEKALMCDKSSYVALEEILRISKKKSPVLGHVNIQEMIAVGAWYIWWERREHVKGEAIKQPTNSAFANNAAKMEEKDHDQRWKKPQSGSYKLNIDASFFDSSVGAIAAILRNHRGEAVAGDSKPIYHVLDVLTAETMALMHGLKLLERTGCDRVEVESDSFELVNLMNGAADIRGPNAAVLADCIQLSLGFSLIEFRHCVRDANEAAHALARRSYDNQCTFAWGDTVPSFLLPLVIPDASLLQLK